MATRSRKSKGSRKKTSRKGKARRTTARKAGARRKPARAAARRRPARRKKAAGRRRANPLVRTPAAPVVSAATLAKLLDNPRRRKPRRRKLDANPRRRAKRRARPRRRALNANPRPIVHVVNTNPWYGQPRRHAKAAKKGWARRRRGKARKPAARRRSRARCTAREAARVLGRRGGLARHEELMMNPMGYPESGIRLQNPLEENPFTMSGAMNFVLGAGVAGLSFWGADLLDKVVATRTPKGGKFPYYGAEAAAAQNARPDAIRFAAQIGASVASLLGAWGIRRHSNTGAVVLAAAAVGFLGNTFKMLGNWYLGPALLKVKPEESTKASWGNRVFAIEQDYIQKEVSKLFTGEEWKKNPNLVNAQTPGADGKASAMPIQNGTWITPSLMQLGGPNSGKARTNGEAAGTVGSGQSPRVFMTTGRLGNCPSCGGHDGCYSDCGTLCPQCDDYCPSTECTYVVQRGDDLAALAQAGGVSIEAVNAMNGGSPDDYWIAGRTVRLPYGICQVIHRSPEQPLPEQPSNGGGVGPFAMEPPAGYAPPVPGYTPPVVAGPQSVLAGSPIVDLWSLGSEPEEDETEQEEA